MYLVEMEKNLTNGPRDFSTNFWLHFHEILIPVFLGDSLKNCFNFSIFLISKLVSLIF